MPAFSRRAFLQSAGCLAASGGVSAGAGANDKPLKFRLGIVTYNVAAKWDLPTILKVCKRVGLSPVELRTTHKHGVEPSLTKDQRADVRPLPNRIAEGHGCAEKRARAGRLDFEIRMHHHCSQPRWHGRRAGRCHWWRAGRTRCAPPSGSAPRVVGHGSRWVWLAPSGG